MAATCPDCLRPHASPECPPCPHESASFDRSVCACGSMHDYCDDCGEAIDCPMGPPASTATASPTYSNDSYADDVGQKADAGKTRLDLLPVHALEEVAAVFTFGAGKYGERNWHGLSVSRLHAAALRHLFAWWRGEDADPETGRSHLAHAGCCVLMALEQTLRRPRYDDRPRD